MEKVVKADGQSYFTCSFAITDHLASSLWEVEKYILKNITVKSWTSNPEAAD